MKLRVYTADNGIILKDVEDLDVVVIKTDESKDELYKEIGRRIYNEWMDKMGMWYDKNLESYGVVIDVKINNISKDPL